MSCLALAVGDDCLQVPAVRRAASPVVRREVAAAELTPERRAKRDERWMFCFMTYELSRKGYTAPEAAALVAAREAGRFPSLLEGGKHNRSQLTYANYRNWTGLLGRKGGQVNWDNRDALADRYATGPMESKVDTNYLQLFNSFFLNRNCLELTEAMQLAAQAMRKINPFATAPTERQMRYYVSRLDPAAVALARLGEEHLKNHMLSYINRDWSEVLVNQIWIADHRVFDCAIKDWDEAKGKWVAKRPWICGMMDAKSWRMVSCVIQVDSPNNETIRQTLAEGIAANGGRCPEYIYSDNGKDFLKQGFTEPVTLVNCEHSIFKELGIKAIVSLPYNGRAKPIERNFKNIATKFDRYFAGYLGNKPGARPDAAGFYWDNPELLPNLQKFCELFAAWMELFHQTPNNGKILGGKSPGQVWESGERVARPAMSEAELFDAFLLPLPTSRTVHRGPAVGVDKTEYYSEALWPWMDREVMVKTDRLDDQHVYVYELNGRPIGECRTRAAVKALALTEEERAAIGEGMATQRRQLKRAYSMLDVLTGGRHVLAAAQQGQGAIVKVAERKSVKGASHKFAHYELETSTNYTNCTNLDFGREEKKANKLEEFGEQIMQAAGTEEQEPKVPVESLNEFHMFMTGKRGDEDEY